jgi:hypothetical protein
MMRATAQALWAFRLRCSDVVDWSEAVSGLATVGTLRTTAAAHRQMNRYDRDGHDATQCVHATSHLPIVEGTIPLSIAAVNSMPTNPTVSYIRLCRYRECSDFCPSREKKTNLRGTRVSTRARPRNSIQTRRPQTCHRIAARCRWAWKRNLDCTHSRDSTLT